MGLDPKGVVFVVYYYYYFKLIPLFNIFERQRQKEKERSCSFMTGGLQHLGLVQVGARIPELNLDPAHGWFRTRYWVITYFLTRSTHNSWKLELRTEMGPQYQNSDMGYEPPKEWFNHYVEQLHQMSDSSRLQSDLQSLVVFANVKGMNPDPLEMVPSFCTTLCIECLHRALTSEAYIWSAYLKRIKERVIWKFKLINSHVKYQLSLEIQVKIKHDFSVSR